MLGSSKLGLMIDSERLKVAARLTVQDFPRPLSRWTMEAVPFSSPIAVAGYQGSTSLLMRFAIKLLPIFDCRMPIFLSSGSNDSYRDLDSYP
jgi:hypothetical protein